MNTWRASDTGVTRECEVTADAPCDFEHVFYSYGLGCLRLFPLSDCIVPQPFFENVILEDARHCQSIFLVQLLWAGVMGCCPVFLAWAEVMGCFRAAWAR